VAGSQQLSSQYPHHPTGYEYPADEHGEAIQAIADLIAGRAALSDAKHDRGKDREKHSGSKVRKGEGHGFFPIAM
jgi:hypothetical protein